MKNFSIWALLSIFMVGVMLTGCDSFVSDVDDPIDLVPNDALNSADQVPFLITGVQRAFSAANDNYVLQAGGLSDELFFDRDNSNATFPTFEQIDNADIQFANNSVDGTFDNTGVLRLVSDDLVRRVQEDIEFTEDQAALRDEALFTGHFYGAIARYYYATYIGLDEGGVGGGVIDAGPFIPAPQMYQQALDKLDQAASTTLGQSEINQKYINTLRARIYLFQGEYGEAATAASTGLAEADPSQLALYNVEEDNDFFNGSGPGRSQFAVPERFASLDGAQVFADPTTAEGEDRSTIRIPLYRDLDTEGNRTFFQQAKYLVQDAPIEFITWEENALMLAELAVRGEDISGNPFGTTDALELVNLVRSQYNDVDAFAGGTTVDLELIEAEREAEFFVEGHRLPDQRRFGSPFITQDLDIETETETSSPVPGDWRYLPITQGERNQNENF